MKLRPGRSPGKGHAGGLMEEREVGLKKEALELEKAERKDKGLSKN